MPGEVVAVHIVSLTPDGVRRKRVPSVIPGREMNC
jgi:hypothetical protein